MTDTRADRERWAARYAADPSDDRPPSAWVMEACTRIPAHLAILDFAAGSGRHAAALARQGRPVIAMDFVEEAIRRATSAETGGLVYGIVADVMTLPIRRGSVDAVLCTNFLVRSLFADLKGLIKPGGFLVYETYIMEHRTLVEAGRVRAPRSPDYLLEPGELLRLVAPLEILAHREGYVHDGAGERYCASVLCRKSEGD
jgi:SAM-dependent methyltransferase